MLNPVTIFPLYIEVILYLLSFSNPHLTMCGFLDLCPVTKIGYQLKIHTVFNVTFKNHNHFNILFFVCFNSPKQHMYSSTRGKTLSVELAFFLLTEKLKVLQLPQASH